MPLVYSYNSNKGRKEKNDDAVSVSKNKQGAVIGIVCDGVGSHSNASYSSINIRKRMARFNIC